MRLFRTLALTGVLAVAGTACADLDVTNLNAPDRQRAISTPTDVENLIAGSYVSAWGPMHHSYPQAALSTAADAHTSSWGNWAMRDMGWEPRIPINNDPSYTYNNLMETPWGGFYGAIASASDGLRALDGGLELPTQEQMDRAYAFGKFVQGLGHGYLGALFDKAFIVDENSELDQLEFVPYSEVHAAGIQKLTEAAQLARASNFTIPADWLGFDRPYPSDEFAQLVDAWKARLMTQVARSPEENAALPWGEIMNLASGGLPQDGYWTVYENTGWAWGRDKLHGCCISGWAQTDIRTYGPADQSGNYQAWLADAAEDKRPFDMVTPDTRLNATAGADATYLRYDGSSPFRPERGLYHFSNYRDIRYEYFFSDFNGRIPSYLPEETELLVAEGMLRTGDAQGAMEIVNDFRARGGLPPFTSPTGTAPEDGDGYCVPRTADDACGDLEEALKYEKRVELFHVGPHVEYFDDRRWGDLVTGTAIHLPVPGSELLLLLEEIYSFGGVGGEGAAPNLVADFSPEAISRKADAYAKWREAMMAADGVDPGVAH